MQENYNIDDLFKRSLNNLDFEPKEEEWQQFKKGITNTNRFFTLKSITIMSSVIIITSVLTTWFLWDSSEPNSDTTNVATQVASLASVSKSAKNNKNELLTNKEDNNGYGSIASKAEQKKTEKHQNVAPVSQRSKTKKEKQSNNFTDDPSTEPPKFLIASIQPNFNYFDNGLTIKKKKFTIEDCPFDEHKRKSHCYIMPSFGLEHNMYKVRFNQDVTNIDSTSSPSQLQYNVGIRFGCFVVEDRLAVESGILYAQRKILTGLYHTENSHTWNFDYKGRYIDVPLRLKVFMNKSKVKVYTLGGLIGHINLPNGDKFTSDETDKIYEVALQPKSLGFSIELGTGIDLALSKRTGFHIDGTYKMGLTPIAQNPNYTLPVEHFIHNINLGAGMYFKF